MDFFAGLFGLIVFVSLMLVIPAYAYFRLLRHFVRKRKFKYIALLIVPFVLVYLYNFTNTFYCLECAFTFNQPSAKLWKRGLTSVYHYKCFENNEDNVRWVLGEVGKINRTKVEFITNMQAVQYDVHLFYDKNNTDYFSFSKYEKYPEMFTSVVFNLQKVADNEHAVLSETKFLDSTILITDFDELNFDLMQAIRFNYPIRREHFVILCKNKYGKLLMKVQYYEYGKYFEFVLPNREHKS